MFLRRLTLDNVRSIEHLEIDFINPDDVSRRQWTLLLAENGCGKTTVLRCIALLLTGADGILLMQNDMDGWVRNGAKSAVIRGDFITKEAEEHTVLLEIKLGMDPIEFTQHNLRSLNPRSASFRRALEAAFIAGYGASRRLPGNDPDMLLSSRSSSILSPRGQGLATLFWPGAELSSLQNWAMSLDYERGDEGLNIVRSAFESLLPGIAFARIDKRKQDLIFDTPEGSVPLSRLSDGYQNMAGWIGDLLFRITQVEPNLKNPLSAYGILLLDEMDLHLHPVWQRQLMSFLTARLPNFQIIASTHSPLTAQQAGPGELHLLERPSPNAAPVLRRFDGTPRHMRIEDLVVSPWFGVHTAYSLEVEKLRTAYEEKPVAKTARKSQRKTGAAAPTKRADEASDLPPLPVYEPRTKLEKSNRELLEKIHGVIALMGGSAPAPKKSARRKTVAKRQ
jgi:predicted ATPase